MKKIATVLLVVFAVVTANAQRGKNAYKNFTAEQKATLALKKMTLALDLSDKQQRQVKPLLFKQIQKRKAIMKKRKAMKESGKRPSSDEIYAMQNKQLDARIAFKADMKRILDEDQYKRFEKMAHRKGKKGKMKRKRNRRPRH